MSLLKPGSFLTCQPQEAQSRWVLPAHHCLQAGWEGWRQQHLRELMGVELLLDPGPLARLVVAAPLSPQLAPVGVRLLTACMCCDTKLHLT